MKVRSIPLLALITTACPSAPSPSAPARPSPEPIVSVPLPSAAPTPSAEDGAPSGDEPPPVEAGPALDAGANDVEACLTECRRESNACDDEARKPSQSPKGRRGLRQCGCAKISCEQGCKKDGVPFFACR